MSALPAVGFLMEFGAEPAPPSVEAALASAIDFADAEPAAPHITEADLAAAVEDAFARGAAEASAAAEAAADERFAELAADYDHRLAAARQEWLASEGERHSEAIAASMQAIGMEIAGTTARLLWPLVIRAVGAAALDELVEKLEELIARDLGADLAITAPPGLLPHLQSRLAGRLDGVAFAESGNGEIRVAAGKTVLETRVALWVERLEEAFR